MRGVFFNDSFNDQRQMDPDNDGFSNQSNGFIRTDRAFKSTMSVCR